MKIAFVYPRFERHAEAHPELKEWVRCDEYLGPPSLGIASIAAATPEGHELVFIDDRVTPFDPDVHEADLYALSFFTPAAVRGMALGDALLARGKPVVMGGIFPTVMPEVVRPHCTAVVVGEGEPVWGQILRDAEAGVLGGVYRAEAPVELGRAPPPNLQLYFDAETATHHPDDYPLQLSRGCMLSCDACVLPAQIGRTMRFFEEPCLEQTVRAFAAAGKLMSLTEDTSIFGLGGARKRLRSFLRMVRRLQDEGVDARFSYLGISMPMILHLEDDLLDDLRAVGLDRFYLVGGFDPITRKALGEGDAKHLDRAERCIARSLEHGIDPYVSFLVGNDTDDDKVFDRTLAFARRSGIELAEFAIATPYPGTPIWKRLLEEDRIMTQDWTLYNDANPVFEPKGMDAETLESGYLHLWKDFYAGRGDLEDRTHERKTIQF